MLRYWDGSAWSEHRAPPPAPAADSQTGLSNIGDWLRQSFSVLKTRWGPLAVVLAVSLLSGWLLMVAMTRLLEDAIWINGTWTGVDSGDVVTLVVVALGLFTLTGISYLMVAHQLYFARLGVHQSFVQSLVASVKAVPRALGWILVLLLCAIVLALIWGVMAVVSSALGVLLLLAIVPVLVWVGVRLAFLTPAFVVRIEGMNPIQASAEVSRDRFWAVLGRLVLLGIIGFAISTGLNLLTALVQPAVDPDDLDQYVIFDANDDIAIFDLGGILLELDLDGLSSVVFSLPASIVWLYQVAGISVLFAETHKVRPGAPDAVVA